jgi:hypothetical protein
MNIESHPKIGLGNALPDGEVQFIALSSNKEGTTVHTNRQLAKFFPRYSLISEKQLTNGQLILGNSPNGRHPWTGNIFGLAIYNRFLREEEVYQHYQKWLKQGSPSLSDNKSLVHLYLFNEHDGNIVHDQTIPQSDLLIPTTFHVFHKTILTLPWKQFRMHQWYFTDLFINVAGFIPLGFFFYSFLNNLNKASRSRNYLLTILFGAGISLAIELIQVYLPTRSSSFTDLICNIWGTILGLLLFHFAYHYHKSSNRKYFPSV